MDRAAEPSVPPLDADARDAAAARIDQLPAPRSGSGRLRDPACWLAATQGTCPPRPPDRPRVVVVAADHGIAAAGVSVHPAGSTHRLVTAVREGRAPLPVLTDAAGASLRVVDVGLAGDSPTDPAGRYRVRGVTGRIDREDALTLEETERAVTIGRQLADEEVDSGADLLVPAALGVGATTPATVVVSVVTGVEPVAVVGRGSGIDDAAWMRKTTAVRDARRRARAHRDDPLRLLTTAGGADLAALAGFCAQAARRRTPVVLSGPVVAAAALVAELIAPGAKGWWLLADVGPEPVEARVAEHLGLRPLLDLKVGLGDGTAALMALPLLRMAAQLLADPVVEGGGTEGTDPRHHP